MGNVLTLLVVLIVVVAIVVFALLIAKTINPLVPPTPPPLVNPVGFMYECRQNTCDTGLACDSIYAVCKQSEGSSCLGNGDCINTTYCSSLPSRQGVCVPLSIQPSAVTHTPNDPCPCPSNMTCTQDTNYKYPVCKLKSGTTCTSNNECLSNVCISGLCATGAPAGSPCPSNSSCGDGLYCSSGYCQPTGIVTGGSGSYCQFSGCGSGFTCIGGVCGATSLGLGFPCNSSNLCSNSLSCNNVCTYHYPDANTCPCTSQYTCGGGVCQAPLSLPCRLNSHCSAGSCTQSNTVYRLIFKQPNASFTDPKYIFGNVDVELEVVSTNAYRAALGGLPVSKLTGYGTNIYTVCQPVGVVDLDGRTLIPGEIGGPSQPTTGELVDAIVISSNESYVVYSESNGPITNKTLYLFSSGFLSPYNPTTIYGSGLKGTQYYQDGIGYRAIDILSISRNEGGDLLALDSSGDVFVLRLNTTLWIPVITSPVSMPMFYNDNSKNTSSPDYNNISYVSPTTDGEQLQFNGSVSGGIYPTDIIGSNKYYVKDYSLYSTKEGGIEKAVLSIVAEINPFGSNYGLFVGVGGALYNIPGYVNDDSRVLSLGDSIYLYSYLSCIS